MTCTWKAIQDKPTSGMNVQPYYEWTYLFIDESGNCDFKDSGTRTFTMTCVEMRRPFGICKNIDRYRYDLIEEGSERIYFHCANDPKPIRATMFKILSEHLTQFKVNSVVVNKSSTPESIREIENFYQYVLSELLRKAVGKYDHEQTRKFAVVTTLPVQKRRETIKKSTKSTLNALLPAVTQHVILHHPSYAHCGLQVADYCSWSIFRKWEHNDSTYYETVMPAVASETEVFGK